MGTYKGHISEIDMNEYGTKFNLPKGVVKFVCNGYWLEHGNRRRYSYMIVNDNDEIDENYIDLQFSRTKNNTFYIETIG